MMLPPPQTFTFGDMACAVQRSAARIATACCDPFYCAGAVTNHRGVILTLNGVPCDITLAWDETQQCYVGTICGVPKSTCSS